MLKHCICNAQRARQCTCLSPAEFAQYKRAMDNRRWVRETLARKDPQYSQILKRAGEAVRLDMEKRPVTVLAGAGI